MPHTRSAKKHLRKSEKRRVRNRAVKRTLKTHIKRFFAALDGPMDALKAEYSLAAKKLDKAAAKRVIHPNLAARKKSQMGHAMYKKAQGGQTTAPPSK